MATKRARSVFQSSSTGEFGLFNQLKPVKSPVIPSEKKLATAVASPVILPKPVQKQVARRVVPERPRRSIFTLESAAVGKAQRDEKKVDEWRWEFPLSCFHCRNEIGENKDVFMYGYLRAFCSTRCREIQMDLEDRDRETQIDLHMNNRDRAQPAAVAATRLRQKPAKQVIRSPVRTYGIAKFN